MKVYKTSITYELFCLTERQLDKEQVERIKQNIQINLDMYNRLNSNGKLTVISKEIEV